MICHTKVEQLLNGDYPTKKGKSSNKARHF